MTRLTAFGLRQLFAGSRRGRPALAGLGAALSIIGWLRSRSRSDELLYKRKLAEGEQVTIRFLRGGAVEETAIEG